MMKYDSLKFLNNLLTYNNHPFVLIKFYMLSMINIIH